MIGEVVDDAVSNANENVLIEYDDEDEKILSHATTSSSPNIRKHHHHHHHVTDTINFSNNNNSSMISMTNKNIEECGQQPSSSNWQQNDVPNPRNNPHTPLNLPIPPNNNLPQLPTNLPTNTNLPTQPQHLPLYAALFCSIIAITFSIRTQISTQFVTLEYPLRASPFFKKVDTIGLSTWELCSITQDALNELVVNAADTDTAEGSSSSNSSITTESSTEMLELLEDDDDDDDENTSTNVVNSTSTALVAAKELRLSTITPVMDVTRNAPTSYVRTSYHYYKPQQSSSHSTTQQQQSTTKSWFEEPDHDDYLVSGDYPYNDDDDDDDHSFESNLPSHYWNCHLVSFTSKNVENDVLWNISRLFLRLGSIMGIVSTGLLVGLIVSRGRRDSERRLRRRRRDLIRQLKDRRQMGLSQRQRRCSNNVHVNNAMVVQPETTAVSSQEHNQTTTTTTTTTAAALSVEANNLLQLETDSSGYRPISICFLSSYLLQSLTLLFLDSELCHNQGCMISTGAHGLLAACVLWVFAGLLVLLAMKRIKDNAKLVWRFKKRRRREEIIRGGGGDGETTQQYLKQTNNDHVGVVFDEEEDDVESLHLRITSGEVCISKNDGSGRKVESEILEEDNDALNTTVDTEDSDLSLSLEEGCD